ncbi:MAG: D-alanine transaminase [Hyphomicrobiaceae bacterium]|jgi:D-alanine transaminase
MSANAMTPSICYLNGRYLDVHDAGISVLDRGFLFGEGLFEAWRTYSGRPFATAEHLRRMAHSAKALGIPFDPSQPWERRAISLSKRNGYGTSAAIMRLTITRGPGQGWLLPTGAQRPTQLMLLRGLEPGLEQVRSEGIGVHMIRPSSGGRPDMPQLKTINYLPAVLGKAAARERGCFEGIYQLDDGTVLEGTTSNVFIVKNGKVITTPVLDGVLPGVTRAMVLRIARRRADVIERRFKVEDMWNADEIFLTSTSIEIVPVVRVGRRQVASGAVGALTKQLQESYRAMVARRVGLKVTELGV